MARFVAGAVLGVILGAAAVVVGALVAAQSPVPADAAAIFSERVRVSWSPPPMPRGPTPVTVVLSRAGADVHAGPDTGRDGGSSVLLAQRVPTLAVPAFRGGDRRWQSLRRCVAGQFAPFAVTVRDDPPARGEYITVHVGGRAKMLGLPKTIAGIAPHGTGVIGGAHVFVFERRGASARDLCEVAAHEVGHALGLDHTRACRDVMSYRACGKKSFRDQPARCGERRDRDCATGVPTQNSHRDLARAVGLREPAVS